MLENNEEQSFENLTPSPLPLSKIEEHAPLVLDLPDGQQLVVGQLPDGVVIEIATWRGTGRPDSRTNRLMLGVSFDEVDPKQVLEQSNLQDKNLGLSAQSNVDESRQIETSSISSPQVSSSPPESTENIREELLFGRRKNTGHEIVPKKEVQKMEIRLSFKSIVWFASVLTVFVVIVFLGNLKIVHPNSGLNTSLSSANNSLILVRGSNSYSVGDQVVAQTQDLKNSPYFSTIAAKSDKEFILEANGIYQSALRNKIKGKVLLVIPQIGRIVKLFS